MQIKNRKEAGFTLVEIMIVVAIIGLLAAIAIPNFVKARTAAQKNACINNLRQIDGAKEQLALENKLAPNAAVNTSDLYGTAQRQLDALVADWQGTLTRMQQEWKTKFDEYDKRKLIMTEARRAEAEKELRELDQRIADYRNQKFGQNGELFTKQNELMKPIQDRIFKVNEEIAQEEEYDYVLDKSGEILMMYAKKEHDITAKVLERLKTPVSPTTQHPR